MNDDSVVHSSDVACTGDMKECGPQDLVILGVKAHQIAPIVGDLPALFGPETLVLTTQNGIPWWYFQRHGGPLDGTVLDSLDPGGTIAGANRTGANHRLHRLPRGRDQRPGSNSSHRRDPVPRRRARRSGDGFA